MLKYVNVQSHYINLHVIEHMDIHCNTTWPSDLSSMKQFSVSQIEYPLGDSTKKGSHVYFLLQVFWVILLFHQIVPLSDINVVLMSQ